MGKKRAGTSAVALPAQGTKISFGDDDDFDPAAVLPAPVARAAVDDDSDGDSDSDSDAAPEAVGMSSGREAERERLAAEEDERRVAKESAKLRAKKVAEAKATAAADKRAKQEKTKGKRKRTVAEEASDASASGSEHDGEDKRLRPMADGPVYEDESDSESPGEEFHTDDDGESGSGDDEDDEDDDSDEELPDEPLSANEKRMRAQMDAMMAAMEKRALGRAATKDDVEAAGEKKDKTRSKKSAAAAAVAVASDDESAYDLTPGVAPLPASLLAAAEAETTAARAASVAAAAATDKKSERRPRKKRMTEEKTSRQLDSSKTLHLLPPVLNMAADMPPIVAPRQAVAKANVARKRFMKNAMRDSGMVPGRGVLDGRRK